METQEGTTEMERPTRTFFIYRGPPDFGASRVLGSKVLCLPVIPAKIFSRFGCQLYQFHVTASPGPGVLYGEMFYFYFLNILEGWEEEEVGSETLTPNARVMRPKFSRNPNQIKFPGAIREAVCTRMRATCPAGRYRRRP